MKPVHPGLCLNNGIQIPLCGLRPTQFRHNRDQAFFAVGIKDQVVPPAPYRFYTDGNACFFELEL
jgi:hypothetical protein